MMEETVLLQEPKPCVSVCLSSLCSPPPPPPLLAVDSAGNN